MGVDELREENKTLKRNVKRTKEVLEDRRNECRAKERREMEKEKAGVAGRNSDLDSNSLKDADGHSMASFSALGGNLSV